MPTIRLRSMEDEIFEVDMTVAKMSLTIKTMLEDLGNEDDNEVIRMPKISSQTMKVVIDWANHHVNDPAVGRVSDDTDSDSDDDAGPRRSNNIDPWDEALLRPLDTASLFELIMACNYLNIRGLLTVTSKTIANLIKGKTPQQIRQVFNVDRPSEDNPAEDMEDEVIMED